MKMLAVLGAAMCAVVCTGSVVADEIELKVDSGTKTLAEALGALSPALTIADLNGGGSSSVDIRKTGEGTLTFDIDESGFDISRWTGRLYVDKGVLEVIVDASNTKTLDMLGSQGGDVYVASGATLDINSKEMVTNSANSGPKRTLHIQGTGATGMYGAVRLYGSGTGSIRSACPYSVSLDDDASISFRGNLQLVSENKTWRLNGHTLTFTKNGNSSTCSWVSNSKVQNPGATGKIVFDGVIYQARMSNDGWEGGAENEVVFRNGAYFNWNLNKTVGHAWTLVYEDSANQRFENGNDGTVSGVPENGYWKGPAKLSSAAMLMTSSYGTDTTSDPPAAARTNYISFASEISGAGGLWGDSDSKTCNYRGYGRLALVLDGANTFTGPLALKNFTLNLGNEAAIPPDNDKVVLTNCTVSQTSAGLSSVMNLQTMELVGESAICGAGLPARVTAKKLTKSGAGTLSVQAERFMAEELRIGDGTVKFAQCVSRELYSGLVYGYHSYTNWNTEHTSTNAGYVPVGQAGRPEYNYVVYENGGLTLLPGDFYTTDVNAVFGSISCAYRSYSGYIWNDSDADVRWTFLSTLNSRYRLKIGDEALTRKDSDCKSASPINSSMKTFTLKPGPNRFEFTIGNAYAGAALSAFSAVDDVTNWSTKSSDAGYANCGLFLDRQGRDSKDIACYEPINSSEKVSALFSCRLPGTDLAVGKLSGSGTVDLDGGTLRVGEVVGSVAVVNGTVELTKADADQVLSCGSGTYALVGDKNARADAAGLWTGETKNLLYKYEDILANASYQYLMSNDVVRTMDSFYQKVDYALAEGNYAASTPWGDADYQRYKTWSGYLWNNSPTAETWTVVNTMNAYARLTIGDQGLNRTSVVDARSYGGNSNLPPPNGHAKEMKALFGQFTLQPGANFFSVRYFNRWNCYNCWPGASLIYLSDGSPLTDWADGFGLMFDPLGRNSTNFADYRKFADSGDGLLFTTRTLGKTSCASVTGVKGTVLDLCGFPLTTAAFAGAAKVENGELTIGGPWTMTPAEIGDDGTFLDGVTFGSGVTFDVSDDVAALKAFRKSGDLVLAKDFKGPVPTLGANLAASGRWALAVKDDELVLRYLAPGLMLVVR